MTQVAEVLPSPAMAIIQQKELRNNVGEILRRAAAQAEMMDIANRQQQYLLANRTYASKSELESGGYALSSEVSANYGYDITLGSGSVPTFTITFTPTGAQAGDGALTLTSEGVKTPTGKW